MTWPSYPHVFVDGYELGSGRTVRRTELEDGRVRQALDFPGAPETRTVRGYLESDADLVRFKAWASTSAHAPFDWDDYQDGVTRSVRVVGGAGGIRYRAYDGGTARQWDFELSLEDA
ncbi:MAG: hypothetical protein OXI15_16755 [Chromatiales bacterium]|nr:hypothetical protein [Chromatiales bacterium]